MVWPPMDNFWRLITASDRWESLGPMIEPRWGHRMVAHDGRLLCGGWAWTLRSCADLHAGSRAGALGPRCRARVTTFQPSFSTAASGPSAAGIPGAWLGSIFTTNEDSWQPGPELPAPTSGAAEGVIDGVILIYGGEEPGLVDGGINDRHWMLDTRGRAHTGSPRPHRRWRFTAPTARCSKAQWSSPAAQPGTELSRPPAGQKS